MSEHKTIRHNKNRLSTLIDSLILFGFLYYLFFLWARYPYSMGGSLIFFTPIGYIFYLSFVYKDFRLEFSLLSLIIFSLMCLNFAAYIEYFEGFSEAVLVGVVICQLTVILSVIRLMRMAFEADNADQSSERRALNARVSRYLASRFAVTVVFLGLTAAFFLSPSIRNDNFLDNKIFRILNFSTWGVVWINIAFLLALTMKKRSVDRAIKVLVARKKGWAIASLRRKAIFTFAALFSLGSVFELMRGLWIVWFCSWTALLLAAVTIWRVWRHYFTEENLGTAAEIKEETIEEFPSLEDPSYMIKYVGIGTVLSVIYVFLLFMIWAYWGK